jgi:hypothetical protein
MASVQKCTERTRTVRNDSAADLLVLRVATPDDTFQDGPSCFPRAGAVSLCRVCWNQQGAPILFCHNNGGWHVSLAKAKSSGSSIQRLPVGLGDSVHGSSRNAFDVVPAPAHLISVQPATRASRLSAALSLLKRCSFILFSMCPSGCYRHAARRAIDPSLDPTTKTRTRNTRKHCCCDKHQAVGHEEAAAQSGA